MQSGLMVGKMCSEEITLGRLKDALDGTVLRSHHPWLNLLLIDSNQAEEGKGQYPG